MDPSRYLPRQLPEKLKGLADLALDLRWNSNHAAHRLWEYIDAELWQAARDPWMMLESITDDRLDELLRDNDFLSQLAKQLAVRARYLEHEGWFPQQYGTGTLRKVAYFSMEFGLNESLPIYSGGLGILAGDYLKAASDLAVPIIGVGLLYQQGYFRQAFDQDGRQLAFFPYNNPTMLPVIPLRDADGGWLRISIELPGRTLHLRAWRARVGRIELYLLDSNDLRNRPGDRSITSELYGGGAEMRLQQEIVLGIGGWRMLRAVGIDAEICHLNEGHAAFAVLERARDFMTQHKISFDVAMQATRAGNLFTTHTPVEAGFDRFSPELMQQYLSDYCNELGIGFDALMTLGRREGDGDHEPFNMAYLAVRGSLASNGVSRLHGAVSRYIFEPLFPRWPHAEVPIGYVTNGVHVPSWDSSISDALWTKACGEKRWLGTLDDIERNLKRLGDDELWRMRGAARAAMVQSLRTRVTRQRASLGDEESCHHLLDPNVLTIGFARRFATYKRPNLLLLDEERLLRLLTNTERPVQLVLAGKAHPADEAGQRMVQQWNRFLQRPEVRNRAVFVEDYDLSLAALLVQGVDVWLNTPRRPWEASGTSGMKVLVNGGLNLSELDGWWAEAYCPEVGWALGDGHEHDADPAWDRYEAEELYRLLEQEVAPAFYDCGTNGIPIAWITRMRESMARLTPQFSTNRMLREYTEQYYLPGAERYRRRCVDECAMAKALAQWQQRLREQWDGVRFGHVEHNRTDNGWDIEAMVYLGELAPEMLQVELYAEGRDGGAPERVTLHRDGAVTGATNAYIYLGNLAGERPIEEYTPRIIPCHDDALLPAELPLIRWPH